MDPIPSALVQPRAAVTIVGGGLAGMIAALRLAERGCQVVLYEASHRLGGKAGADQHGTDFDEHGYHIFPMWYRNIWQLVAELGIQDHFADVTDFMQLQPGNFPHHQVLTNLGSPRYLLKNLFSGVLPVAEMALFFYSTLDLMSHSFSYRAFLDQTSVNGFVRGRFYRTERVALQHQDLLLKGISVPSYDVSAMTMRNVLNFWFRYPEPMHRVLKGNLQSLWISPLQKRLTDLGVQIHLGHKLKHLTWQDQRITAIEFSQPSGVPLMVPVDRLLIAIPWEKLLATLDDTAFQRAPSLFAIRHLDSSAMAALNIYFNHRIPSIPKEHVNLLGSRYGLSFIDVGQWWPEYQGRTVLNLIASNFTPLAALSPAVAIDALIDDLIDYIPTIQRDAIDHTDFQSHTGEPLFMNRVASWHFRPTARTPAENLYLAGDYCRSHIDLVSMEGAVSTGLLAAEAIRTDLGLTPPIEIFQPETYSRWLLWLLWFLGLPIAAFFKLLTLIHRYPERHKH